MGPVPWPKGALASGVAPVENSAKLEFSCIEDSYYTLFSVSVYMYDVIGHWMDKWPPASLASFWDMTNLSPRKQQAEQIEGREGVEDVISIHNSQIFYIEFW